ncbi:MAG: phage head closure protein [Alteromonas macleodii]
MIDPGELDQLINIKRHIKVPNDSGGKKKKTIIIDMEVWAKSRPLSGGESERFDKLNATGTQVFIMHIRDDLKQDDIVEWDGKDHNIRYIKPHGDRKLYLEVFAEYGVAT